MNREKAIEKALANIDGDFIKALTEPARLEILKLLILHGSLDVKTLADKMPQDRSVISRHLIIMEKCGLLSASKKGRHMFYEINTKSALEKSQQLVESFRLCSQTGCC